MDSDEGVFLIPNTVSGDYITFHPLDKRRGSQRGLLLSVEKASPKRIKPPCDVAELCGGCALQPISESSQMALKSEWVRQAFQPCMDKTTLFRPVEQLSGATRRRIRWWRGEDAQGGFLGFRARSSHQPVRQNRCEVVHPAAFALKESIQASIPPEVVSVQVTVLHDGLHVVLEAGEGSSIPELSIVSDIMEVEGLPLQWWVQDRKSLRPLVKPLRIMHDRVPAGESWIMFRIGPDDFVQGQEAGNIELVRQVQQWCRGAHRVVDLFSGVGNLSLPLAALGMQVIGAEVRAQSVSRANASAKEMQIDARYHEADLFGKFDLEPFTGADVLILDPPRKGARKVCVSMNRLLPAYIIMISCDIASGARDAEELMLQGYSLRQLRALDLFPFTGHVEAMSLWSR